MTRSALPAAGRRRRFGPSAALAAALLAAAAAPALAQVSAKGQWGRVLDWPMMPIHTALLPDGKIMSFGATPQDGQGGLDFDLWDPTKGTGAESHLTLPNIADFDSFCVAAILDSASGKLLMAGGRSDAKVARFGFKNSNSGVERIASTKYPRYYASFVTLPDGRILIHGGSPAYGNQTNASEISEIYTPGQGWSELSGTANSPMRRGDQAATGNPFWYPHVYPIGNNEIFTIAGKYTYRINYSGNGSVTDVKAFNGSNYGATSSGLMYRPGLAMQIGGGSHGNNTGDGHPGSNVATIFDLRNPRNITSRDTTMAYKRHWPTATVLPNGEVLVVGGSEGNNELQNVAYAAEIYNPDSDQWRTDASMKVPRLYHSTALLLKDGRVLAGGGGAPGPLAGRNAEIYTPGYLLDASGKPAARPSILSGPNRVALGQTFRVAADKTIRRMTIVKSGAVTHGYNTDQRFFEASFSAVDGGGYDVVFPNDAVNATPGLYMLFAFDAAGVPSVGKYLRLPSPTGDENYDAPGDTPTNAAPTTLQPADDQLAWTKCADENGTCTVPDPANGAALVRYGANGYWSAAKSVTNQIACTNAVFGDPLGGAAKICQIARSSNGGGTGGNDGGTATAALPPSGPSPLVVGHSKLCLSVKGGSNADGADLLQETCKSGSALQTWTWRQGNGGSMLVNGQSGKCLDVFGGAAGDGTRLVQWPCHGNDNQLWNAKSGSAGTAIVSKATGKCVDVSGISVASGAQVWQWSCLNAANQSWSPGTTGAGGGSTGGTGGTGGGTTTTSSPLVAGHSKLCLSVKGGSNADGADLLQETCKSGSALQTWTWRQGNGGYMLVNGQSGKCLDVWGGAAADGTRLVQWACHGNPNQLWSSKQGSAGTAIVSKATGKCVDVAGVSAAVGAQVWQWSCLNAANQSWSTGGASGLPTN